MLQSNDTGYDIFWCDPSFVLERGIVISEKCFDESGKRFCWKATAKSCLGDIGGNLLLDAGAVYRRR